MGKSIITAWEVVKFSPVSKHYPTAYLCIHIERIEKILFNKCYLGLDLYNYLLNDLVDYENTPQWENVSYDIDSVVLYEGCLYKSKENANTEHPADSKKWCIADKFKTECNNTLWNGYLKYYLSFMMIYETILYSTVQATAQGLITTNTEDTQSADPRETANWRNTLYGQAVDNLDLMLEFIETSNCNYPIKKESGCGADECRTQRKKHKRFHFKY